MSPLPSSDEFITNHARAKAPTDGKNVGRLIITGGIAATIGVVAFFILCGILFCWCRRRKNKTEKNATKRELQHNAAEDEEFHSAYSPTSSGLGRALTRMVKGVRTGRHQANASETYAPLIEPVRAAASDYRNQHSVHGSYPSQPYDTSSDPPYGLFPYPPNPSNEPAQETYHFRSPHAAAPYHGPYKP